MAKAKIVESLELVRCGEKYSYSKDSTGKVTESEPRSKFDRRCDDKLKDDKNRMVVSEPGEPDRVVLRSDFEGGK